ncbi:MAG: hypothetical protein U5L96_14520 [Owenweeksia sp.]|nr:hypothetical protein [Owenweeksia sp.]
MDGQYLFSDNINDAAQLLNPVLTANGFILNNIGNYASVSVLERGFYFTGELSKTLPFWQANSNSGPDILLGAGFLRHWIEIKNAGNDAPMLLDEYAKGYDHLSQGFLLKQSIGYRYLSRNRRVILRLSFEIMMQAFTTNLRGFDYSTGQSETGTNLDLLYGFRLQWILPLYGASNQTYYFD